MATTPGITDRSRAYLSRRMATACVVIASGTPPCVTIDSAAAHACSVRSVAVSSPSTGAAMKRLAIAMDRCVLHTSVRQPSASASRRACAGHCSAA